MEQLWQESNLEFYGKNKELMDKLKSQLGFIERYEFLALENVNSQVNVLYLRRNRETGNLYLMISDSQSGKYLYLKELKPTNDSRYIFQNISGILLHLKD